MSEQVASGERRLVFVSHANPYDNDITLWLASKLTCAGYLAWSDLTALFGGDIFWDEIEEALRNHTAKFLALVSQNSQQAPGFLDELDVAVKVQRTEELKRFVIPVRVDTTPFPQFRANLGRRNAIDFSLNWAHGLAELLAALEKDGVPRAGEASPANVARWLCDRNSDDYVLVAEPQTLASNWLPIDSLPPKLFFSRFPVPQHLAYSLALKLPYPTFVYEGMYGSFANAKSLQPGMPQWFALTHAHTVSTSEFLSGKAEIFPNLGKRTASNLLCALLRDACERLLAERGLVPMQMSDLTRVWFYPAQSDGMARVGFTDLDGQARTRQLVGRSVTRDAYWHYAVSVRPALGVVHRLCATAHVVFTRDGRNPVHSPLQMLRLRRGFCRMWWNDKWRTLLSAFLARLASGKSHVLIPLAPDAAVAIAASPMEFVSPVLVRTRAAAVPDNADLAPGEEADDLATLMDDVESTSADADEPYAPDLEP